MYTAGKPTNAYVDDFLYFVANEGQKQVADVGFISQEVQPVFPEYLSALPKPMQGLVNNAYRLSLNFRFNNGSAKFDNKAQRDVDRLLEFMSEHPDAELMLFGFASESDDAEMTMLLSKHRAMAVSRALRRAAIYPDVVRGFGSQAPVAAVEDNDGRQKNSRVEVWIRPPQAYAEVY
jgi:phosphate transport system substrate-binding protein